MMRCKALQLLFSCIEDLEPTVMGDLALTIFRPVYIVHCDGFDSFMASDAHSFPSGFIQKVFCGTTIN